MKKFMSLSIFVFIALTVFSKGDPTAIQGYWFNDSKEYIVEIYLDGDTYKGKVVWMADSLDIYGQPLRDVMNHKPEQRSRLVKNLDVLAGFRYDNNVWKSGKVYYYQSGNNYSISLRIGNDGNLKLTGYYGLFFFLSKTKIWTHVKDLSKYDLD